MVFTLVPKWDLELFWDRWCTNRDCSSLSPIKVETNKGDYTTIQGAIDDRANNLQLISGTYNGSSTLIDTSRIDIQGNGKNETILKNPGGTVISTIRAASRISLEISDLKIKDSQTGISQNGYEIRGMKINNVRFENNNKGVNTFRYGSKGYDSYIRNSIFRNNNVHVTAGNQVLEMRYNNIDLGSLDTGYEETINATNNYWTDGIPNSVKNNNEITYTPQCTTPNC